MKISKVERFNERIYEGKRSAVLYTQGCNLRCPYCEYAATFGNPESGESISRERILSFLEDKRGCLNAVVLTGGEPTLHENLRDWMADVKALGFAVKLETNGTFPHVIRELLSEGLVDYIAMDVKAPLENYATLAGCRCDVEAIRTSIWVIKQSGVDHEFRTTVVPGLHTVRELKSISELVHGAKRYVVQDFVSKNPLRRELAGRPAFPSKPLEDLNRLMSRRVERYEIRHYDLARKMPVTYRRRRRQEVAAAT